MQNDASDDENMPVSNIHRPRHGDTVLPPMRSSAAAASAAPAPAARSLPADVDALPPHAVFILLFLPRENTAERQQLTAAAMAAVHREQPPGHVIGVHDGDMLLRRVHAPDCGDAAAQCGMCAPSPADEAERQAALRVLLAQWLTSHLSAMESRSLFAVLSDGKSHAAAARMVANRMTGAFDRSLKLLCYELSQLPFVDAERNALAQQRRTQLARLLEAVEERLLLPSTLEQARQRAFYLVVRDADVDVVQQLLVAEVQQLEQAAVEAEPDEVLPPEQEAEEKQLDAQSLRIGGSGARHTAACTGTLTRSRATTCGCGRQQSPTAVQAHSITTGASPRGSDRSAVQPH
jgi:hypothetical protein